MEIGSNIFSIFKLEGGILLRDGGYFESRSISYQNWFSYLVYFHCII